MSEEQVQTEENPWKTEENGEVVAPPVIPAPVLPTAEADADAPQSYPSFLKEPMDETP